MSDNQSLLSLSEQAPEIGKEGGWIDVKERSPGEFVITGTNITNEKLKLLAFASGDGETSDIDGAFTPEDIEGMKDDGDSPEEIEEMKAMKSDEQALGMSARVQWNEVILTPKIIHAPSLDRLREALSHVVFTAWRARDL